MIESNKLLDTVSCMPDKSKPVARRGQKLRVPIERDRLVAWDFKQRPGFFKLSKFWQEYPT